MRIVDSFEYENKIAVYLDVDESDVELIKNAKKVSINNEKLDIVKKDFLTSLIGKRSVVLLLNTSKLIDKEQNIKIIE